MKHPDIAARKRNHITACLQRDVQSKLSNGFEKFRLVHNALPNIDFHVADHSVSFLNKKISFPLMISSMTGGTDFAEIINRNLAIAAEARNIPFALGSQRVYLKTHTMDQLNQIRRYAPNVPVLANIGAIQLNDDFALDDLQRIIDSVAADALILHFNPLQEVFQTAGDTDFAGLLAKIETACRKLTVPVIAKEVGFGFSVETARLLAAAGISWLDVAGAGGTSWVKVEQYADETGMPEENYPPFYDWGIPTALCIESIKREIPAIKLIASGGIRNGVEMRKALLLGASLCGMALPFLKPATESVEKVIEVIDRMNFQYRAACFVSDGIERI